MCFFFQAFGYLILIKNFQDVYCHHFYTYFTYQEEKNREIKDPAKIKQLIKCKVKIRSDYTSFSSKFLHTPYIVMLYSK